VYLLALCLAPQLISPVSLFSLCSSWIKSGTQRLCLIAAHESGLLLIARRVRAISSGSCVPSMVNKDDIISTRVSKFWCEVGMLAKLTTLAVSRVSVCGGEARFGSRLVTLYGRFVVAFASLED